METCLNSCNFVRYNQSLVAIDIYGELRANPSNISRRSSHFDSQVKGVWSWYQVNLRDIVWVRVGRSSCGKWGSLSEQSWVGICMEQFRNWASLTARWGKLASEGKTLGNCARWVGNHMDERCWDRGESWGIEEAWYSNLKAIGYFCHRRKINSGVRVSAADAYRFRRNGSRV